MTKFNTVFAAALWLLIATIILASCSTSSQSRTDALQKQYGVYKYDKPSRSCGLSYEPYSIIPEEQFNCPDMLDYQLLETIPQRFMQKGYIAWSVWLESGHYVIRHFETRDEDRRTFIYKSSLHGAALTLIEEGCDEFMECLPSALQYNY